MKFIDNVIEWWNTPEEEDSTVDRVVLLVALAVLPIGLYFFMSSLSAPEVQQLIHDILTGFKGVWA